MTSQERKAKIDEAIQKMREWDAKMVRKHMKLRKLKRDCSHQWDTGESAIADKRCTICRGAF